MHRITIFFAVLFLSCSAQKKQQAIREPEVERILKTLSSDDMNGRAAFTGGVEKAATFIEKEFREIGLLPIGGETGYRQNFNVTRVKPGNIQAVIDGRQLEKSRLAVLTDQSNISFQSNVEMEQIKAGENLFARYSAISKSNKRLLVLVDNAHAKDFESLSNFLSHGRVVDQLNNELAVIFVLGLSEAKEYSISANSDVQTLPLFNVAGKIPGKSRPNELVIFSAHYDHIGVLTPVAGDSIANGADDDASGVTAVLTLARHYKKLNQNERTLIFAAFTAEELGMIGSKYFSRKMNADSVVAMFNIEMIGKESKFGQNTAFITGFERSDFGTILQKNLEGTGFSFHPDPYKEQNLFYRSDNATLAALGVPAHTISTDQIDKDKYYHTVDDEYSTLNIKNITSTIQAIALSSRSIVSGKDTPKRIPKLTDR